MYLPRHFAEDRVEVLHQAMQQAGLATLVTLGADGLTATHLPLLLDPSAGPYGTLRGHVARANGQWRDASPDVQALVIFMGPQAYVSPAWYASKRENGRVVPTWNYLAVHAYGPLRSFDDPVRLREHVTRLTTRQEAARPDPWQVTDAPQDYVEGLIRAIVGVEIPIERLEGKWKMSQNRPEADRLGTIAGLEETGRAGERAVAGVMRDLEAAHGE